MEHALEPRQAGKLAAPDTMLILPPPDLLALVRRQTDDLVELVEGQTDIWTTGELVDTHIDYSCDAGLNTYLWIIQNDQGCELRRGNRQTPLPVGATLRFCSLQPHSTAMPPGKPFAGGRLAFLAWDMPADYTMRQFRNDLRLRIDVA